MEKEIWVEMWDYPTYEVSNLGRVRRAKTERLLTIREDGNGYNVVCIFYNKKKHTKRLGKVIWQSFNECDCAKTIDHIDRNKSNDRLDNLRCVTMFRNYKNRVGKKRENKYNLTPELKALIHTNFTNGTWSSWYVRQEYGIPINYTKTTMKRNSWEKFVNNEGL